MLARIQNDLFDLGADLCRPGEDGGHQALRIPDSQVERLEREIDAMNEELRRSTRSCCRAAAAAAPTCIWPVPWPAGPSG